VIVELDLDLPLQNSKLVFDSQALNFSFRYFFPGLRVDLYFVDWFYRVDPITRMIIPLGLSYLIFTVIRTTTISRDVERWYRMRIRGQEDPF